MSSSVNGGGGELTMYLKHCLSFNFKPELVLLENIPQGFVHISTAACKLCLSENRSHSPSQSRVAFA